MIDDPLTLLSLVVWLMAAGMYPLGFLFGACSPCCQGDDDDDDGLCPWLLEFDRCLRVSVVGSDPPDGGDCRLFSHRAGSGDVQYMASNSVLQIHNVQSRIRITVRLSLSASGASRTPVGETRTQVWRFNRATPSSPALTAYDVLGPAWHLQVDLSVTGVATQEEAGVTSSIGEDEHGQPKLILSVNQWTSNIVRDEVVALFPTGLQRWGPGLSGTQTFRLTSSSANATRVDGDAYSGWNVSKLSGLTIDERLLAVRVSGSFCSLGAGGTVVERIILDDDTAVDFLNGDEDVRIITDFPSGERDLRILANSALCETSATLVGIGAALGIYPDTVYADAPQAYLASNPNLCRDALTLPLRISSGACPNSWTSGTYRSSLASMDLAIATPSGFWSGRTLLWNATEGPHRTSFTGGGPGVGPGFVSGNVAGWTYRITEGSDNQPGDFFLSPRESFFPSASCAGETQSEAYFACVPNSFSVSVEFDIDIQVGDCSQGGDVFSVSVAETMIFGRYQGPLNLPLSYGPFPDGAYVAYFCDPDTVGDVFNEFVRPGDFLPCRIQLVGAAGIPVECDLPSTPDVSVNIFYGSVFGDVCNNPRNCAETFPPYTPDLVVTINPLVTHQYRRVCGAWSPNEITSDGASVSRECQITDTENVDSTITETQSVAATRSRLPANLSPGYGQYPTVNQSGRCRFLGLRATGSQLTSPPQFVSNPLFLLPQAGDCVSFFLLFGETNTLLPVCSGDPSAIASVPCDDCMPVVNIVSGEEYASVVYRQTGSRAGTLDVIAKTTWLGGQGVTFTVSCGGDTITQTIRRANTVPTAPRNLTVTRGPCSEALLQWDAPEWNGGQPITAYNIQFRRIGGSYTTFGTVAPPALSATVTGLLRLGYEFRVSATSSVGTSAFSNVAVDGFTLAAPTSLTAAPRDPCDAVSLSWTPPTQSECVVVAEYQVQFRVSGGAAYQTFATVPGTDTTATVTGLTPTTAYQFRIGRVDDANTVLFSNAISVAGCPPE